MVIGMTENQKLNNGERETNKRLVMKVTMLIFKEEMMETPTQSTHHS